MTISVGTRLGPYEILAPLGAGGMGEVYRAKDTKLGREVAIKVLPEQFFEEKESIARFEREAKSLAAVNHPHIAALYSFDEVLGRHVLVMELAEGQTLSERLLKGPLAPDQLLRTAIEIASALDAAHRAGIVHRDLKPGNVMLTKSGTKLLDFGLAKAAAPLVQPSDLTSQPTELPKNLTQKGTILGTLQYMAPEQLEGKEADARSDIFAFGALLYEMATGRKAFEAKSQASLITAIMSQDPPAISSVQPMSPPALDRVVRTCLARDPEERWQSAGDLKRELRWIAEGSQSGASAVSGSARPRRGDGLWKVATFLLAASAVSFAAIYFRRPASTARPLRFSIAAPAGTSYTFATEEIAGPPALSPDGRWLVFTATDSSSKSLLWLRAMASLDAKPLAGTDNGSYPFWSPDSRFIGFFAGDKLKKLDILGGAPEVVCSTGSNWQTAGTWSPSGTILFASDVLRRVSASGGTPQPVTKADPARIHRWPYFLPDSEHFLYVSMSRLPAAYLGPPGDSRGDESKDGIYVGSLASTESRRILRYSSKPVYSPSGHVLVVSDGNLLAVPFDAGKLEVTGEPFRVADRVGSDPVTRNAFFTVSSSGILAYQTSDAARGLAQLVWFDRSGKRLGTVGEPRVYGGVRRSPDGRRAAVEVWNERMTKEIWLVEFSGGLEQRVTSVRWAESPAWSPDGKRIGYALESGNRMEIREKEIVGSGRDEGLFPPERLDWTGDWSPDGRSILLTSLKPGSGQRFFLSLVSLPQRKVAPWLATEADERDPLFSPDGRWEAHGSNESGLYEIYVRPFPGPGGKWQVSRSAGSQARWRGDGRELFYLSSDGKMMSVETKATASGFEAGPPKVLFEAPVTKPLLYPIAPFDVSADGQRFLIVCPVGGSSPPLTVVVNWTEELKK